MTTPAYSVAVGNEGDIFRRQLEAAQLLGKPLMIPLFKAIAHKIKALKKEKAEERWNTDWVLGEKVPSGSERGAARTWLGNSCR